MRCLLFKELQQLRQLTVTEYLFLLHILRTVRLQRKYERKVPPLKLAPSPIFRNDIDKHKLLL